MKYVFLFLIIVLLYSIYKDAKKYDPDKWHRDDGK
jgi:hypothetical protein